MKQHPYKLTIIHTNDLHSHFERMPQISAYIDEVRSKVGGDNLLSLDIGDHMDRMRQETEGTGGFVNIEVLNATGIEAIVLGNNEGLTYTPPELKASYEGKAQFPVIASNITECSTGTIPSWMVPYHIVRKGPMTLGLIGVTAAFPDFYRELGWNVTDPLAAVRRYAEELKPKVDMLIVLSHLGIYFDERMASEIDGIDLILGGHTHHVLHEPPTIGTAKLCAAGKFGQYIGEVEVEYDVDAARIINLQGRLIETDGLTSHSARVADVIARSAEQARMSLSEEVARLRKPIGIDWYGESVLGNLLAAGLRRWAHADIGLVNAGQVLSGLAEGTVTRGHLHDICPGPINPCRYRLSGGHLREALEQSLLPEMAGKPIRGFGFRGEVLGVLCVDGLRIEYDLTRPVMSRITDIRVNGDPFDREREYIVGTIDMFTFGVGYMSLSKGHSTQLMLPEFLRDVLAVQLRDEWLMEEAETSRWHMQE